MVRSLCWVAGGERKEITMLRPVTPDAYRRYVPGFDKRRSKKDVVGGGRVGLRKKKKSENL